MLLLLFLYFILFFSNRLPDLEYSVRRLLIFLHTSLLLHPAPSGLCSQMHSAAYFYGTVMSCFLLVFMKIPLFSAYFRNQNYSKIWLNGLFQECSVSNICGGESRDNTRFSECLYCGYHCRLIHTHKLCLLEMSCCEILIIFELYFVFERSLSIFIGACLLSLIFT